MSFMDKSSGDEHTIGGPDLAGAGRGALEPDSGTLVNGGIDQSMIISRHCEERSDEAIHSFFARRHGLLRGACHRARIRATRWLAMTVSKPLFFFQAGKSPSPKPGAAAALAFHHLVALLEQALAFAVLAFRLLLDVGASFIGHDILPAVISCTPTKAAFSTISKAYSK
jgi:hypothetical protein